MTVIIIVTAGGFVAGYLVGRKHKCTVCAEKGE